MKLLLGGAVLAVCGLALGVRLHAATDGSARDIDRRAEGLLRSRCAVCHTTDLITQQRLDRGRWEATVRKMIHWGADLAPEEATLLVGYLASRYHPDLPDQEQGGATEPTSALPRAAAAAGRPVGVPARGGAVYAYNCQACHGAGAAGGVDPKLASSVILGDEDRFWETVLHGGGAMPAWEALLDAQDIADLLAWLRTIR